MNSLRVCWQATLVLCSVGAIFAQESSQATALLPVSSGVSTMSAANAVDGSCKPLELLSVKELSFHQRTCLYSQKLLSKGFATRALVFSAYAEIKKDSFVKNPGMSDYSRRVAVYYARRTAQSTGELLAGYLAHEDPRFHPSLQHGFWNRTKSAMTGVLLATNEEGARRPAFAPIAGAFGSGLTGVALYQNHNSWEDGFKRSGFSYSTYFLNAFFREFRPELSGYANHFLHKHK